MVNRDQQIYEEYQALVAAKEEAGTVDALAEKWQISRQRLHKIVARERKRRESAPQEQSA